VAGRAEPGSEGRILTPVREIRTQLVRLRPFGLEHEPGLLALWNDPQVRRYLWDDEPVSRETVLEQIDASRRTFQERGFGHFALWPVASSPEPRGLVGFAGLRTFGEEDKVELLYALRPTFQGRGLATDASRAVLRFGFEEAGLSEILAGADPPNAASFRVMERLGMSFLRDVTTSGRPARYYRLLRAQFRSVECGYTIENQEVP
jgi:RimJ/RimL family protein N-acetyltransferase